MINRKNINLLVTVFKKIFIKYKHHLKLFIIPIIIKKILYPQILKKFYYKKKS